MKQKSDDRLYWVERRKHLRFSSSAFRGVPVTVTPLPPFFGSIVSGQIYDLSAGGIAIFINEIIPTKTALQLELTFPDSTTLSTRSVVRRSLKTREGYLIGIEFINLPEKMVRSIDQAAWDYTACEKRIHLKEDPVCVLPCSFQSCCKKKEKLGLGSPTFPSFQLKLESHQP